MCISFSYFRPIKTAMPATLTYRPLTPQNSAKLLRTNTCRFARFVEPRCPHTSGVRVCSCTSIATEPCRPTACAGEHPCCTVACPATAHYSLLTANSSYTFSAKEKDTETGYSYFGSRYYNSDLSIWLSVDPMSDKYPSLSPYVYCADNPVKLVDPNGEAWETPEDEKKANELKCKAVEQIAFYQEQVAKYTQRYDNAKSMWRKRNLAFKINYNNCLMEEVSQGLLLYFSPIVC